MKGHSIPDTTVTDSSKQTTPGFLRLPPDVRERIFRHLGMAGWEGDRRSVDLHGRASMYGVPPSRFYGLLLCCRIIYAEATALLCSTNRFFIYYSGPGSLKPLHALTPTSLASLGHLKVILNQASCHQPSSEWYGYWCCRGKRRIDEYDCSNAAHCNISQHSGRHRHPLANRAPFDYEGDWRNAQTVLDEWQAAAAYMSPHISADQLQLSLVCDIDHEQKDSIGVAEQVVAPLQLLPRLKTCSVRLCATPTRQLRQLARDAALRARGFTNPYYNPHPALTTLTTLPRELRLRILEYTDLITPYKEVGWSRSYGAYSVYKRSCLGDDYMRCVFPNHHGCQFTMCSEAPGLSDGCFCRRRHSAFSLECRCWTPPGPALFLVCRTLCQDAQFVFFSGNRFIVGDSKLGKCGHLPEAPSVWLSGRDTQPAGSYPYNRFAISQFVKEIVPVHCLAYIRFLELVFPPYYHHVWPRPEHPAMKNWHATVHWLKDKINAPGLTVRLVMADVDGGLLESDRGRLTELEGKAIVRAYMNISSPLRHLTAGNDGLAMFYAQFAYPWAWTDVTKNWVRRHGHDRRGWVEPEERELEDFAERYVMGARYDKLYGDNRELPDKSMWQFWGILGY
ncbi:uncharacterized protein B0H64DRAFT_77786 [Chaetomium fimeti]|uniref:F-box domain-containing protein n=1 Tax=Chaetomium fimeti TaxID=1854472 RepID=A0AAE0HL43_9PEZI|nr:hypothetical protein B0H64DRAFT_77786 [Chaetomium fimeti]